MACKWSVLHRGFGAWVSDAIAGPASAFFSCRRGLPLTIREFVLGAMIVPAIMRFSLIKAIVNDGRREVAGISSVAAPLTPAE